MQRDGKVIAILNSKQVLVQVLNRQVFRQGTEFTVFEEAQLPGDLGGGAVQLPKGHLVFQALQTDRERAVLAVEEITAERQVPGAANLGAALDRLIAPLGETRTIRVVVDTSAQLNADTALDLEAGPVTAGDYVSADD